jgi:pyruvate/2-oxoglutarate dehydrogenase complex dihydrolipoamide dehydrogenase (E3) component
MPPFKNPIQAFTDYLVTQLRKLGVEVKLETEVTPELVNTVKPDVVILANGGVPFLPNIPGIDRANVMMADDVLKGTAGVGPRVVIVGGGMVGCEIADFLSDLGKKVTVLEMLPELAPNVGMRMRNRLLERLAEKGVKVETKARCTAIGEKDVLYLNEEGQILKAEADTVVLATGSKSNRSLYSAVGNLVPETYLLGDSIEPRQILEAVAEGYQIGSII